jgi:histidinol dehydrogenase
MGPPPGPPTALANSGAAVRIEALTVAAVPATVATLRPPEASSRDIAERVAVIIADVRARGDAAVAAATARFDWPLATAADIAVPAADLDAAYADVEPQLLEALRTARDNCTFFHRHELREDWEDVGAQGQVLGIRHLPVDRAGLYVPGGQGAYASTVIMNSVPALVAGVKELVICTPPGRDGAVNRSVLAAARLMGVERVFRVGGAQAIAAMANGTETVPQVDVICGPGNAYVMEAKRQVYGRVGIDSLAGPSEVLVVADSTADPEWIAADMLAQEEHGSGAEAMLIAQTKALCEAVERAVTRLLAERGGDAPAAPAANAGPGAPPEGGAAGTPPTAAGAGLGARRFWAFYPGEGEDFLELAAALVNSYAPEHLEVQVADPRGFLARVRSAGAIFLGQGTPTAFGDYIAGSNHVLPTGGSARFSSPLSVDTFMRKSSFVEVPVGSARLLTSGLARIADSEGFFFHRRSAELRTERDEPRTD